MIMRGLGGLGGFFFLFVLVLWDFGAPGGGVVLMGGLRWEWVSGQIFGMSEGVVFSTEGQC